WAASGQVINELLEHMLQDPYLHTPPPKSTGRQYFNLDWLQTYLQRLHTTPGPADVQATLCELTACTIANAITTFGTGNETILLCGGGAYNAHLHQRLAAWLAPLRVSITDHHGMDAGWIEAA